MPTNLRHISHFFYHSTPGNSSSYWNKALENYRQDQGMSEVQAADKSILFIFSPKDKT